MTQIGFHNWLVAVSSQKAALAAWDIKDNLFATGAAKVVTDPACVALALTTPGTPVAVDSKHDLAKLSRVIRMDDHRKIPARSTPAQKKPIPPKRQRRDRSRLDQAEQALDAFKKRSVRERAGIVRARRALDLKAEKLEDELAAEQETLTRDLRQAEKAYTAESS